jgi:hypothetical protein
MYTLRKRRYDLDPLVPIQVHIGSKFSPRLLETAGLRGPARYIRECSFYLLCFLSKNCLPAG